jgi:hypothetical protein
MPKHSTTLRRGGGGLGLGNGATVAAGAAGSTRTLDRHPSRPAPLPHPSRPTPLPHPSHISFHPPRNPPPLSCRVARRRQCSLGGPTRQPSSLGAGRPVAVHAGGPCRQGIYEHWFANRTAARTANRSSAQQQPGFQLQPVFSSIHCSVLLTILF